VYSASSLPSSERSPRRSQRERSDSVVAAPLTALLLGIVVAVSGARGSDWPAHQFRIELFRDVGLTLWNGQWYSGHYTLGYSVVYPPLASWFGPLAVGIASGVVASAALADLLWRRFGVPGAIASCWFAVGTAVNLAVGRLPFALGLAFGLVALLAYQRRWVVIAVASAALTSLASPVAGAFLAIALGGALVDVWLQHRSGGHPRPALPAAMLILTVTPIAVASALFPDPGVFPFRWAAFAGVMTAFVALVVVLPSTERVLRLSAGLGALVSVPLFVVANPLGGNMTRLVAFFVAPVLAASMWKQRRTLVIAAGVPLALWLLLPGVAAADHLSDPAADAGYYDPVTDFITHVGGVPGRLEVPFTAGHWEVTYIAAEVPIARGWERQTDMDRNAVLYDDDLTSDAYRRWIDEHAVRWIALPDTELDRGGLAEAALLERDLPWLQPVRTTEHWQIWEVVDSAPIVEAPGRLVSESADEIVISVERAGSVLVRTWYMPYWSAQGTGACVVRTEDGLVEVVVTTPGIVHLRPEFSLDPLVSDRSVDDCNSEVPTDGARTAKLTTSIVRI
jgi:hypothetical protein